jgi:IclR family transcriptional regulator, acetate operon repressor
VRKTQPARVQSVDRALQILLAFESAGGELRVTDLAARLDVHKSTASRLAATLAAHGFLERADGAEAFRLGRRVVRLGMAAAGRDLVAAARPAMEELAAATGETVVLSVAVEHEAVDVAQVDSRFLVGGKRWLGLRTPLHASSDGKVLLAYGAAELAPGTRLAAVAPQTLTSRKSLEGELDEVRRLGWSRAVGECEEGLNGVAAPIIDGDGRCLAALSVSGPAYRLPEEKLPSLGARCAAAAAAVSAALDWSRDAA